MKIGFAGTPAFAQAALETLLQSEHQVAVVLTQPDRPAGRGMKLTASAVKQTALEHSIAVLQPHSLKLDGRYPQEAADTQALLESLGLDVLIVAAYGLILPQWVLELPKHGCLNIHASLLPRWRGAAPIQRAIEAGDQQTGITIMQMDEGLDTGAMLLTEAIDINERDNAQSLHDKLAKLGAKMIVQALKKLEQGELIAWPQPNVGITYAHKIDKTEAALQLGLPARQLAQRIRAFNPFPGATLTLPGITEPVKVWDAVALDATVGQTPGTIIAVTHEGIDIATGNGTLRLLELQRPGGKRMPVSVFVQSYSGA
ncbi:methionyl-tRNA formyltransferase [Orrella daihaiensis]|uniref:Methionyl-tRNA formyltransferase n=1 Tax=Orrella daihaiensis TaxID=2782176 RepID=A0ABY4AND9_9BURK|nr:methionyl-tRNA formyltransferase [Orrella daihaiensis]UOD50575.1 methionyl-tRNA formyltransferase [Orrella daihaiensis]